MISFVLIFFFVIFSMLILIGKLKCCGLVLFGLR